MKVPRGPIDLDIARQLAFITRRSIVLERCGDTISCHREKASCVPSVPNGPTSSALFSSPRGFLTTASRPAALYMVHSYTRSLLSSRLATVRCHLYYCLSKERGKFFLGVHFTDQENTLFRKELIKNILLQSRFGFFQLEAYLCALVHLVYLPSLPLFSFIIIINWAKR